MFCFYFQTTNLFCFYFQPTNALKRRASRFCSHIKNCLSWHSFDKTCENLKSPITRMTTKFSARKLISNFILFENLKKNNFFLFYIFYKRTVLRKECVRPAKALFLFVDAAYIYISGSREGKLSNPRGRAARARCMIFSIYVANIPKTWYGSRRASAVVSALHSKSRGLGFDTTHHRQQ